MAVKKTISVKPLSDKLVVSSSMKSDSATKRAIGIKLPTPPQPPIKDPGKSKPAVKVAAKASVKTAAAPKKK